MSAIRAARDTPEKQDYKICRLLSRLHCDAMLVKASSGVMTQESRSVRGPCGMSGYADGGLIMISTV